MSNVLAAILRFCLLGLPIASSTTSWSLSSSGSSLAFSSTSFQLPASRRRHCRKKFFRGHVLPAEERSTGSSASKNGPDAEPASSSSSSSSDKGWIMKRGMVFSSFSDGIVPNLRAKRALRRGLVGAVLRQRQRELEDRVRGSALHSPCAGPDIRLLNLLDFVDRALERVDERFDEYDPITVLRECLLRLDDENRGEKSSSGSSGQQMSLPLRLVYVPTAMYALRKDSASTPGKQRQRARADAKKRRDEICRLVSDLFSANESNGDVSRCGENAGGDLHPWKVSVAAVTLDWDDGSLKHVACAISSPPPLDGRHALAGWTPHLVYVQGGNTFWLHHCLDKGKWGPPLVELLRDGSTYYCGASAGAILAGVSMDPATWKKWDDCSVVPGRENYADWRDVRALRLAGPHSFFPHMSDEWKALVDRKVSETTGGRSPVGVDRTGYGHIVVCLRDQDVCLVDGSAETLEILSSPAVSTPIVLEKVAAATL